MCALLLGGCATGPQANPSDPFEPFNRQMYGFNDAVDRAVLKPVAIAYRDATPDMARTGVRNFFANLGDAWSFVNNVLQLKPQAASESFIRFNVNTLFGLGGLLDIASEMDIDRHKQDFGQTLARWGVPSGPYLVLPILGPSTVRDTAALPVDAQGDLLSQVHDIPVRNSIFVLRGVDTRANLLRAGDVLDDAALDRYSFTRDVYLQLRKGGPKSASGGDGEVPEEDAK
ncbi:VacJ family lipoprotein [Ramlibacter sp. H39-3-26]|nr:VacJ family lipoprotein [Ramlibacter sp. H39-3-26]MDF1484751.1 VacJ family lipoprotein [Ramlibacter sp. H39-3-26]